MQLVPLEKILGHAAERPVAEWLGPNASFTHAIAGQRGFFSRQHRAEFCFDSWYTLAKFVEFVAARLAETNSHEKGAH